jgi:hypothetical protein
VRISARVIPPFVTPPRYSRDVARPKVYDEERIATAIRLPASLRVALLDAAFERDVSVNLLVTRAISDYLARLRPVEDDLEEAPRSPRPRRRGSRWT